LLGWAPVALPQAAEDTAMRLAELYSHRDPALASALKQGLALDKAAHGDDMKPKPGANGVAAQVGFREVGRAHGRQQQLHVLAGRGHRRRRRIAHCFERLQEVLLDAVASYRKLDPVKVRALVEEGRTKSDWALEQKLIDQLGYQDEVESLLRTKLGVEAKEKLHFVPASRYRNNASARSPMIFSDAAETLSMVSCSVWWYALPGP
jgi:hypothetical protein